MTNDNLSIEPNPDDIRTMRTTRPLRVAVTTVAGIRHIVSIPADYVFDGASIPWFAWWLIGHPFTPSFVLAACVHDWYCDQAKETKDYQLRVIGDAVFFALLTRAGVPEWKRVAMYAAVRLHAFCNKGAMR